jgi:hypothetical protein
LVNADVDFAAIWHGIARIDREIEECEFDLMGIDLR